MSEKQSIQETLSIIRKALEDEDAPTTKDESKVLILNKMVKDDGTIQIVEDKFIRKDEIKEILNQNISKHLDNYFEKWLDKNIPNYLDKYFKNKK